MISLESVHTMIDISRIRSVKSLEKIRITLNDFLTNSQVLTSYIEDYNWSEEDYETDKEQVIELLDQIEMRIKSLTQPKVKQEKSRRKKGESSDCPTN